MPRSRSSRKQCPTRAHLGNHPGNFPGFAATQVCFLDFINSRLVGRVFKNMFWSIFHTTKTIYKAIEEAGLFSGRVATKESRLLSECK